MCITTMLKENRELMDSLYGEVYAPNWEGTPWEQYCLLGPKQKGGFGEATLQAYLEKGGHEVSPPYCTGHDRIINGETGEIKFSVASSNKREDGKLIDPDSFTFNHIAVGKDWDVFWFVGINPEKDNPNVRPPKNGSSWPSQRIYTMKKGDFVKHMNQNNTFPFRAQQGGKHANNDDYIVAGHAACQALFNLPFVKEYTGAPA